MRRIQYMLFALSCSIVFAFGQVVSIDKFDHARPDTVLKTGLEAPSVITLTNNAADKAEGTASMAVKAVLASKHSWGTYAEFGADAPAGQYFNWSSSESLSVWIKVKTAPAKPENISFRFQFTDQPSAGDPVEFWDYENKTILDKVNSGWVNLRVSLRERTSTGGEDPDSTGFILPPTSWGLSQNNKKFDLDKLVTWRLVIVSATIDADSIEVAFDGFERFGTKAVPVLFFNGIGFNAPVSGDAWAWGNSSVSIENGAGLTANQNAVKWVQGTNPSWGGDSGYTGWGVNLDPTNMVGAFAKDSIKFWMKAAPEATTNQDSIRVQLEGDGTWKKYAIALKDLVYQDNTGHMDSTKVNVLGFMAQKSGKAGRTIYMSNIWTGNPVFDVIPPAAPTSVAGVSGAFTNIITWTDVPGEAEAKYNVYFSETTFSDPKDSTVEDLPPYNLAPLTGAATHVLRAPLTDQSIGYYYGVNAKDGASNIGPMALSAKVTTTAKGVPVINNGMPTNYATDAVLTEWTAANIKPFAISKTPATGEGHVVTGGVVDNDADLLVKSYIAMDANNLYVAFDVVDDIVSTDSLLNLQASYAVDCPDLFIGLYDWRGKRHNGYTRGAKPEYHLRFSKYGLILDNPGNFKTLLNPGVNYSWKKKALTPGYIIEAKIPFQLFADSSAGDVKYTPKLGHRIAMDFSVNDNDGKTFNPGEPWNARDGILCYSQFNDDNSWQDMWRWSHTWVGAQWKPNSVRQDGSVATSFELSQNFPNPFNPTTSIRYSVPVSGMVTMKIYDVLGRAVMTVVNQHQEVGSYTVNLNGADLASGIYVYKIEAGSFTASKKMMLIK
ncbi:MAG: T9SS type A sorting domain-containing protein [Bacteroidetes bacterium]|nr:T9SS type A sorting domain-containing protein [Bacteroidota bacterium]